VANKLNITACIVDTGFFVPLAEHLAQHYAKVLYYCPRESGYMRSDDDRCGEGIEGVEKIYSFWDRIDEVDLFVFTDCYFADVQEYLKKLGKRVWGSGKTSWMELDRFRMREWQEKAGLPTPETMECIGIEDLKESLGENQFVKINKYRADMETAKHYDAVRSDQRFDDMKVKFGAYKDQMPFLVENKIEGVEIGIDTFSVDGKNPKQVMFGLEIKDCSYLCRMIDYADLPDAVKVVNDATLKVFTDEKMRGSYSSEIRIDKKGDGYLVDLSLRMGNPPYQLYMELWENFAEIIYAGAGGEIVEPIAKAKYGAIAIIQSEFAVKHWLSLKIPKEIQKLVKIMNMTKVDGEIYSVPLFGLAEVGAVVGIGDTAEAAIEMCKKNAEQIEGDSVEIDVAALDQALETLRESEYVF
jgi:hypothetical protein